MYNTFMVIFTGLLLGFTLYWSGVAHRRRARSSLRLENLTIARILLYALGYAMFLLAVCKYFVGYEEATIIIKGMSFAVVLGGVIFGLGLGVLGNCPGTSLAALPYEHKCKTVGIILGGVLGYWLFGLTADFWYATDIYQLWNIRHFTLYQLNEFIPSVMSCGYGGIFFLGVLMMIAAIFMPKHWRHKEEHETFN